MSGQTTNYQIPYASPTDIAGTYPALDESAAKKLDSALNAVAAATTALTTGWMTLTLGRGWSAASGHTPRARLLNGFMCIEGAVLRGSGGNPATMATLPSSLSAKLTKGTQFIGGVTAARNGVAAACQLYISSSGVISMLNYTAIDSGTGWVVPLSVVFAPGA